MGRACGNCARFTMEDIDGYGWCLNLDEEFKCDGPGCSMWEPIVHQIDLTPDLIHPLDLCKLHIKE